MSKAKDILEKLKQRGEAAETVRAYWAETLPGIGQLPEPQLQSWLIRFDLDAILGGLDAAVNQRSKLDAKGEPMTAPAAVSFASAVINRLHLEGLPEAEREKIKAYREHIRSVRSSAGKLGNEKRWHSEPEVANPLPENATACDGLRPDATPLRTEYGFGFEVGFAPALATARAAAADKSAASTAKEKAKAEPETKTNPVEVSGLSPNQKPKTKMIKTAKGDQPKPEGFDEWTNIQRTNWIACTCEPWANWGDGDFNHRPTCAVKVNAAPAFDADFDNIPTKPQAKAAAKRNAFGEPWL